MQLDTALGQDETVQKEYEFSYSLLLFFLKSHFWLTNKRLIVNAPNVFLFIPTGNDTVTYPWLFGTCYAKLFFLNPKILVI